MIKDINHFLKRVHEINQSEILIDVISGAKRKSPALEEGVSFNGRFQPCSSKYWVYKHILYLDSEFTKAIDPNNIYLPRIEVLKLLKTC